jgi:hypothetical protein
MHIRRIPACRRAATHRALRAVAPVAVVLAVAACSGGSNPSPPPGGDGTAQPRPPETAEAIRQIEPGAPHREVDWSILRQDPFTTPLGQWEERVETSRVCLDPESARSQRCELLQRQLKRVANRSEINDTIAAVDKAIPVFQSMWRAEFARLGRAFRTPAMSYYGLDVPDSQRVIQGPAAEINTLPSIAIDGRVLHRAECPRFWENSVYCPTTNELYLDAVYLTRIAAAIRETDRTSGRFAALSVAAHELGHAVHLQTHDGDGDPYTQEMLADCFAGASLATLRREETGTGASQAERVVKTSDALTEGQLAMYLIGGPVMTDGVHESGPVRANFFTRGFNRGVGNCVDTFRQIWRDGKKNERRKPS